MQWVRYLACSGHLTSVQNSPRKVTQMFSKWFGYGIAVIIFIAGLLFSVYQYGEMRYDSGKNKATVDAQKGIDSLQHAINELNRKDAIKRQEQLEASKKALQERNKQVTKISTELYQRKKEIERLKNESKDDCVNRAILIVTGKLSLMLRVVLVF